MFLNSCRWRHIPYPLLLGGYAGLFVSSLIVSNTYFNSGSLTSLSINPLTICLVVLSAAPSPLCCVFTTYSYTNGPMYNEHKSAIQSNSVFVVPVLKHLFSSFLKHLSNYSRIIQVQFFTSLLISPL